MQYLEWEVVARSNTRSCSYAQRDMIAALEREGCAVARRTDIAIPLLRVVRVLKNDEEPRAVREAIDLAIRIVHPRAFQRFKGLKDS